jgi:hypothetical protein
MQALPDMLGLVGVVLGEQLVLPLLAGRPFRLPQQRLRLLGLLHPLCSHSTQHSQRIIRPAVFISVPVVSRSVLKQNYFSFPPFSEDNFPCRDIVLQYLIPTPFFAFALKKLF